MVPDYRDRSTITFFGSGEPNFTQLVKGGSERWNQDGGVHWVEVLVVGHWTGGLCLMCVYTRPMRNMDGLIPYNVVNAIHDSFGSSSYMGFCHDGTGHGKATTTSPAIQHHRRMTIRHTYTHKHGVHMSRTLFPYSSWLAGDTQRNPDFEPKLTLTYFKARFPPVFIHQLLSIWSTLSDLICFDMIWYGKNRDKSVN